MQPTTIIQQPDPEAVALAACYRLLLQKARERRARLAVQAAQEVDAAALPDEKSVKKEGHDAAAKIVMPVV